MASALYLLGRCLLKGRPSFSDTSALKEKGCFFFPATHISAFGITAPPASVTKTSFRLKTTLFLPNFQHKMVPIAPNGEKQIERSGSEFLNRDLFKRITPQRLGGTKIKRERQRDFSSLYHLSCSDSIPSLLYYLLTHLLLAPSIT